MPCLASPCLASLSPRSPPHPTHACPTVHSPSSSLVARHSASPPARLAASQRVSNFISFPVPSLGRPRPHGPASPVRSSAAECLSHCSTLSSGDFCFSVTVILVSATHSALIVVAPQRLVCQTFSAQIDVSNVSVFASLCVCVCVQAHNLFISIYACVCVARFCLTVAPIAAAACFAAYFQAAPQTARK